LRVDQHTDPSLRSIEGALPISNALGVIPGSREQGTTVVTYLYFDPSLGLQQADALAHRYAAQADSPSDSLIGVTGTLPARLEQSNLILAALPWVELATVLLILAVVGLTFRSIGAPLVTLFAAGTAYLIAIRIVAWVGRRFGVSVPQELEPLIVVLLLGIVTDYSIFFLTDFRDRLRAGDRPKGAIRKTSAEFTPIIFTAGLTVAAGTAALAVARLKFIRAFGPGLALTVVVGLLVAITLVPATLALLGRFVYSSRGLAGSLPPPEVTRSPLHAGFRIRMTRLATAKPIAAAIVLACLLGLAALASGLRNARLGFSLVSELPASAEARRAADAAGRGFAPGVLSPVLVLVEGPGMTARTSELARLEDLIGRQPGVAAVIGPREQQSVRLTGAFLSSSGDAARYAVIFDHDPLAGIAVNDFKHLRAGMPDLVRSAGLSGVSVSFAGDTALVEETIGLMLHDLGRVALATLAIDLALLIVFLRALLAPLYLLAASVLALGAALGLTTYVFQGVLRHQDLTYYVPFAAAVLLVSLGSDYNIFIVGRIWDEARGRGLRDAISLGAARATRPITIAGLTLALSFAMLAIVPLVPFWELAFALSAGVLIDSFVVRSYMVPGLISLFGEASWWPWQRRAGIPERYHPAGGILPSRVRPNAP
ncbi:MAG TPA: MMPL family transporter, partial [Actinomycetota bacterium]|nr:MMPL family transporter [Actinomycetota bacterium]